MLVLPPLMISVTGLTLKIILMNLQADVSQVLFSLSSMWDADRFLFSLLTTVTDFSTWTARHSALLFPDHSCSE